MRKYILDEHGEPVRCDDLIAWVRWFEAAGEARVLARDEVAPEVMVSTVFLGLDHNFMGLGAPLLFETMIFGGEHDEYQRRYSTREGALAGHAEALALAQPTGPARKIRVPR